MPARSMWKGVIRFGDEALPVKLYAAVQDRDVHFHLLHDKDGVRVKQRVVNPETHEAVETAAIRKGFPVDAGTFVIMNPGEIAQVEPKPSRDIAITRFVPATAVPEAWYARPYYLGPDGAAGSYFALVEALRQQARAGIASWTMRKKPYHGALRVHGDHLVLISMHNAAEILDAGKLAVPSGRDFDRRELQLAEQLVAALAGEFDPGAFHDEHRERLLALIDRKAKGKPVRSQRLKPLRRATPDKLSSVLAASLSHVRKERRSA